MVWFDIEKTDGMGPESQRHKEQNEERHSRTASEETEDSRAD